MGNIKRENRRGHVGDHDDSQGEICRNNEKAYRQDRKQAGKGIREMTERTIWQDCYNQRWGDNLVKDAYQHPAKVSFKLAERIYRHTIENGWIGKGGYVLDPFGGICGFGFHAMINDLNWIGVELEEKFVQLGQQNIELWNRQFRNWPNLGTARIVQGDSRRLKDVIKEASFHPHGYNEEGYGVVIEKADINLVVSSPPFSPLGNQPIKISGASQGIRSEYKFLGEKPESTYGQSVGQLGAMKEGFFDITIFSPPCGNSHQACSSDGANQKNVLNNWKTQSKKAYSENDSNLGNSSDDTFWSTSKIIVQNCFDLLKVDSHIVWVCKNYIKAGKIVPFSDRWLALCESIGFKLVCRHQAALVKDFGVQKDLLGEDKRMTISRKSFFRRLAERKGAPRIDFEDVICMVKG